MSEWIKIESGEVLSGFTKGCIGEDCPLRQALDTFQTTPMSFEQVREFCERRGLRDLSYNKGAEPYFAVDCTKGEVDIYGKCGSGFILEREFLKADRESPYRVGGGI